MAAPYSRYMVKLSLEPGFWGAADAADAARIVANLTTMIHEQFPGIAVGTTDGNRSIKTSGPDGVTVKAIDAWVSGHWPAAL